MGKSETAETIMKLSVTLERDVVGGRRFLQRGEGLLQQIYMYVRQARAGHCELCSPMRQCSRLSFDTGISRLVEGGQKKKKREPAENSIFTFDRICPKS